MLYLIVKGFSLRILALFLWASSCNHLPVTEKQGVLIKINATTFFWGKKLRQIQFVCVSCSNHNVCTRSGRLIEAKEGTLKRRNYLQAYWAPKKKGCHTVKHQTDLIGWGLIQKWTKSDRCVLICMSNFSLMDMEILLKNVTLNS